MAATKIRWKSAEEDEQPGGQGVLFSTDQVVDRHVGTGEFRGLEFLHVNARRIINEVPAASRMPFRYTINAYRGCSHSCVYCTSPETPILMADGSHRRIAELQPGDEIYGTERVGSYRRFVKTTVLAHWETANPAWRVALEDGTELIASGDHRFLTNRGWKFVTGAMSGLRQRPYLTVNNNLVGTGQFAEQPKHDSDYTAGYLTGMIRGDGTVGSYRYERADRGPGVVHRFRLALVDREALDRTKVFLERCGVPTTPFLFTQATATRSECWALRTQSKASVSAIADLIVWPSQWNDQWSRGFLAGIFDAEGGYSRGILRIYNTDQRIIDEVCTGLRRLGFPFVLEQQPGTNRPVTVVRITGGIVEHLRFFHTTDPAITRKRSIEGQAIKNKAKLRVAAIEPMGLEIPMFDISTGTGDFIANGVVSHNCFARPTHDYLGLNIGTDFDSKIVVKVNAVERLRAELRHPKWAGEHIAMGTNTDPYQRCEGKYHLTKGIIAALGEAANPFSILTKSTLILRDLALLQKAAERTQVRTSFSIGTLDENVWRRTEPGTPHPRQRVEAVRKLNQAGIPCGVLVAPLLPGLSDSVEQVEEVVSACVDAGAVSISGISLHLRPGVKEHFLSWLEDDQPDLVPMYRRRYRGAYLPKAEQQAVSAAVASSVTRAKGNFRG